MTADEALNRIRTAELPDFDGRSVDSVFSESACGDMPLHIAAIWGDAEMLIALIEAGAPLDAPGEQEMTPLHYAIEHGHIDCIRLLIVAGSSLTANEKLGLTPFELASLNSRVEIREMFERKNEN